MASRLIGVLVKAVRCAAWILLIAIAVLSLVPPTLRPETGTPHIFEHAAIFAATGAAFGFGYSGRAPLTMMGLVIFAAAVEAAQLLVPGRHARLSDFVVDALACCAGVAAAVQVVRRWPNRQA